MKNLDAKRCFLCQSSLKKVDRQTALGIMTSYECALFGEKHYVYYLGNQEDPTAWESVNLLIDGKQYCIHQFWDNNDVVIFVYDKDNEYLYSTDFKFSTLALDFLGGDLSKIVGRLKLMLVFQ